MLVPPRPLPEAKPNKMHLNCILIGATGSWVLVCLALPEKALHELLLTFQGYPDQNLIEGIDYAVLLNSVLSLALVKSLGCRKLKFPRSS